MSFNIVILKPLRTESRNVKEAVTHIGQALRQNTVMLKVIRQIPPIRRCNEIKTGTELGNPLVITEKRKNL